MEAVRDKFGKPMERERDGHTGGGQLFVVRRETDHQLGVLSAKGHSDNYLAFRPSNQFMRNLGDDVLRLNDALFEFRGQAVEHLMVFDDDELQAHYGELNKRFEVVRDRLLALTAYCNKGFDRQMDDALEIAEKWAEELSEVRDEGLPEMKAFGPLGPDVYEAVRQRNLEEGILTESGSKQGYVAFKSCPFYGRVVGEIVYTFNDALQRVEGRTAQYNEEGRQDGELRVKVRQFYTGLMRGMKLLRGELEEVVNFCGSRVESV